VLIEKPGTFAAAGTSAGSRRFRRGLFIAGLARLRFVTLLVTTAVLAVRGCLAL